ncbi:hypothetical protein H4P12_06910 [Paracoccus sp. 11-3]|uniref:Uncharacterized protein n=1 Tax=Paracoccus amoyensis TaxID=2760093 RepID=A0A926GG43_9RHOB|nr:hypothetical protein [Paracoccus amoyensis]MBC9246447.1 hypothetical protein [Paracoccus amoyensis]
MLLQISIGSIMMLITVFLSGLSVLSFAAFFNKTGNRPDDRLHGRGIAPYPGAATET